ncbi:DUF4391 domain-containing protein [Spartobacteria bacterium LR76]|nr:DUF4391 domain-containing protein [Spartobacteria bacterium LR76]
MFAYPKQAEFNRVVPKNKIYAHAKPSRRVRELFVSEVGEILWKYKLSPETTNLPARHGITEIEVFEIALRTPELDEAVIQAIDRAIPFPLLFQFTHGEHVRFAASYKRPNEADSSKWVIEACFQTEPQPLAAERPPLPVALDLAGLYEHIVRRHIPLPPRAGESLANHVARFHATQAKRREQQQLEARLEREKQFNRKVELNAALRSVSHELENLKQL